jgi:peptide/nickel transport system ATP-binding protein
MRMLKPVIEVHNLKKYFPVKTGFLQSLLTRKIRLVHAVDGITFQIMPKEVFGLVGESGCGKTTTGKALTRLLEPTEGKALFNGTDITPLQEHEMRKLYKHIQMIFQDPYDSLNPRMTIYDIVAEPIKLQKIAESPEQVPDLVAKALEELGLAPAEEFLSRFPHELSGGQRQRVAIARAFVLNPQFIVADEPTSMLDASTRSEVLDLILKLIEKTQCAFLYITHDIALARYICDRIAIMYLGKIVEMGLAEDVISEPCHPYTKALLAAVPVPDPTARRAKVTISGEVPSAFNPPTGCRFHPRCPVATADCKIREPSLVEIEKTHFVACHLVG